MKIKEIRLYGFKSFFGETKFLLNRGITAFVGPNGSGKSNIFDALRWVFGEQSMKALRCERNEDLIHSSPHSDADANFTEVSVIIENEEFFPQFGSEFEIKRRFYRSGESEFSLNRVRCRLQDIQALFLNSGTLTYSFLELSEIERIIQGDTKEMFDDVAGILRYQERREQTKRRLEQTEQDLLRLEDVIAEMEHGLRSLKRQARQAQLYHDLKEEYKTYSLALMKVEYNKVLLNIQNIQDKINTLTREKQSVLQELKRLEQERLRLKEQTVQLETRKKEILLHIALCNQEIDNLQQRLQHNDEELKGLALECERLGASIKEKGELQAEQRARLAEYEQTLRGVAEELGQTTMKLNAAQTDLDACSADYFSLAENLKGKENIIAGFQERIRKHQEELAKLEYHRLNKESILTRIQEEYRISTKDLNDNKRVKKELTNELNSIVEEQQRLSARLAHYQEGLKKEEKRMGELETELQTRQAELNNCKIAIEALSHRLAEPVDTQRIKERFGEKFLGLFRDTFEVSPGYESLVDICLGDILNFYVLEGCQAHDFVNLPEGKFGFIINNPPQRDQAIPEPLRHFKNIGNFIKFKSDKNSFVHYLNAYFLVDNFAQALHLSENFLECGFVTAEGFLVRRGLIIVQRGDVGYFKIKQGLENNRKRLETIRNEVLFTQDEKRRVIGEIDRIKESVEQDKDTLFSLNIKKSEISLSLNQTTNLLEKIIKENEDLKMAGDTIDREIAELRKQTEKINEERERLENELNKIISERNGLVATIEQQRKELDEKNLAMNELVMAVGILRERHSSIEQLCQKTRDEIAKIESEIRLIKEDSVNSKMAELNAVIAALRDSLEQKRKERARLESQMPDQLLDETLRNQENIYEQLSQLQKQQEELQNRIMELNYELFQQNHTKEGLIKKAKEEFQTDLTTYTYEEIPNVEAKRTEVEQRIERLGTINPLSLQAYEEEKKRLDEFLGQRNDIIAAKQSLLKSIGELDARARERFVSVFDQVKEKFNMVFTNFFEGGEADLILVDPQNPLTSRVEIVVRMRGKRLKTINQLSGGERTLLAVSLLLAFYLVKPAPFCILDEIDAPLDDTNVLRFNRFLRDLSHRTQVVIITHNRATMEYADYLYGLTMEKPGQSKIVSVRLADLESFEAPIS